MAFRPDFLEDMALISPRQDFKADVSWGLNIFDCFQGIEGIVSENI